MIWSLGLWTELWVVDRISGKGCSLDSSFFVIFVELGGSGSLLPSRTLENVHEPPAVAGRDDLRIRIHSNEVDVGPAQYT